MDVHISRKREKLGAHAAAIETVRGRSVSSSFQTSRAMTTRRASPAVESATTNLSSATLVTARLCAKLPKQFGTKGSALDSVSTSNKRTRAPIQKLNQAPPVTRHAELLETRDAQRDDASRCLGATGSACPSDAYRIDINAP